MSLNKLGDVLANGNDENGRRIACLIRFGKNWERLGTPPEYYAVAMNDHGDVVGSAHRDGYEKPWLRRSSGEIVWLPYLDFHHCRPRAINSSGQIVGTASADHGDHALFWGLIPTPTPPPRTKSGA
jgi:hypothetical protein